MSTKLTKIKTVWIALAILFFWGGGVVWGWISCDFLFTVSLKKRKKKLTCLNYTEKVFTCVVKYNKA